MSQPLINHMHQRLPRCSDLRHPIAMFRTGPVIAWVTLLLAISPSKAGTQMYSQSVAWDKACLCLISKKRSHFFLPTRPLLYYCGMSIAMFAMIAYSSGRAKIHCMRERSAQQLPKGSQL